MEIKMVMPLVIDMILADYSDLSRGHPKMCFSKEIPPQTALNLGLGFFSEMIW